MAHFVANRCSGFGAVTAEWLTNHSRIESVSALACIFQIAVRCWTMPAGFEQLESLSELLSAIKI